MDCGFAAAALRRKEIILPILPILLKFSQPRQRRFFPELDGGGAVADVPDVVAELEEGLFGIADLSLCLGKGAERPTDSFCKVSPSFEQFHSLAVGGHLPAESLMGCYPICR